MNPTDSDKALALIEAYTHLDTLTRQQLRMQFPGLMPWAFEMTNRCVSCGCSLEGKTFFGAGDGKGQKFKCSTCHMQDI